MEKQICFNFYGFFFARRSFSVAKNLYVFPLCTPDDKLWVCPDRLCPDIPRNIWEVEEGPQKMAWSDLQWMFQWKPGKKQ